MNKKLFGMVMALLLSLPLALAATVSRPTIAQRFSTFVRGFSGFPNVSSDALVAGFLAIIPVIGLFFVVFGLVFYLSKITIFRGDDTDKYARWLAIGIGMAGIVQQSVFNVILSWSTTFLILAFMIAIIFMFIVFINRGRKSHYEVAAEMNESRKTYLQTKADYTKEKKEFNKLMHEIGLDDKLYHKTERDLNKLEHDLDMMTKLQGDELAAVDHLADLLRKATAAAQRNEQNQVHAFVQALSRDLGGLITKMSHEKVDMTASRRLLEDIRKNLAYAFKDEKEELSTEKHIEKIFHHHLRVIHGVDSDVEDIAKKVMERARGIHGNLEQIRHAILALRNLEDQVENHMEQLAQYGYESKQAAASAVRDAIMTQDFTEAHKQLDHLRGLIEHGKQQAGDIKHLEADVLRHVHAIEQHDKQIKILIHKELADAKAEFETLKGERKDNVKAADKLLSDLHEVQSNISKFKGASLDFLQKLNAGFVGTTNLGQNKNKNQQLIDLTTPILSDLQHFISENRVGNLIEEIEKLKESKGKVDHIKPQVLRELENLKTFIFDVHKAIHDVSTIDVFTDPVNALSRQRFDAALTILKAINNRLNKSITDLKK